MAKLKHGAKPFVKWVGGKSQLIPTIAQKLPADFECHDDVTYIEPFVGGGAVLFWILQKCPNISRAVINDINADLVTAYNTVKYSPEMLVAVLEDMQKEYRKLQTEVARKEFYLEVRGRFNGGGLSDVDNTAMLIFLNRTCFNGLYRVNSKGEFNVPFGRYANPTICDTATIYADSEILQRVIVTCGDFEKTEQYVSRETRTFLYFDPPYRPLDATSSFNSYSKEKFDDEEQVRLKCYFDRLSSMGCWLMLSNSDGKGRNENDTFFDDLYGDYNIDRVYAVRSVNANPQKRGKLTELLIRNYTEMLSFRPKSYVDMNVKHPICVYGESF